VDISEMKLGKVICPIKVYPMLRNAFTPVTKVVVGGGVQMEMLEG